MILDKQIATNSYHTLQKEVHIKMGQFERDVWYAPGGYDHPLVQQIVTTIQQNRQRFEGRRVYVAGGVLQDWYSWDIDIYIEGEWSPTIKSTLEWLTGLGFKAGVYVDAKLVNEYLDVRIWQDTKEWKYNTVYMHSLDYSYDGMSIDLSYYKPYRDIYVSESQIPTFKNADMDEAGYKYKHGIRIL